MPGYEPLITRLFREGADYLDSDVVFGTKQDLVVAFEEHEPGRTPTGDESAEPFMVAHYDFVLQAKE
jgi:hydroxyquinol 1,2-dioxygenase